MINFCWKRCLLSVAIPVLSLLENPAVAQSDIAAFVNGGIADANTLLKAYTAPFGESFGVNMNSGWTNTANTLNPGRFEVKLVGTAAFVPVNSRTYNLDALGFGEPVTRPLYGKPATEQWVYANPIAPTIFGSSSEESTTIRKMLTYTDPNTGQETTETIVTLDLPQGLGMHINPLPVIPQVSVGLPLGTEIMLRFLPPLSIDAEDNSLAFKGLWGAGIKHDIKQWIPGISKLPFSISVLAGYTGTRMGANFDTMLPEAPAGGSFADPNAPDTGYTGPALDENNYNVQGIALNTHAWNVSVLASKKVSVITGFAGLRYARSVTNIALKGVYGFAGDVYVNENDNNDPNNNKYTLINTERDPIKISTPIGQLGLTGGFRLKLGFISLFAEGTWSRYSTVSAGIGFGWMN